MIVYPFPLEETATPQHRWCDRTAGGPWTAE
jgi:hypothetical protein